MCIYSCQSIYFLFPELSMRFL
uniref:Uncharacterized protein n=1 Tax=Rhizophora mucronata TaxID=61149 RepID=A0A2P2R3K9_RHIMU